MADEGFHEIQLGKKQLFFAFMAATVFTVVVFLLGVWVGKDMPQRETEVAADIPTADVPADAAPPPTEVPPGELDYTKRLQSESTPASGSSGEPDQSKPVEPPTPVESTPPEPPTAKPPAASPQTGAAVDKPASTPAATSAPARDGLTWQVGAFNDPAPANSLADRLKGKGYPAFVFHAPSGPSPYKVRVGPYADRAEADRIASRLRREERLSPFPSR